jgi:hypothetical protein
MKDRRKMAINRKLLKALLREHSFPAGVEIVVEEGTVLIRPQVWQAFLERLERVGSVHITRNKVELRQRRTS